MVDIGATTIGSSLIGTANLTPIEHLVVWCIGGSTLIWGAIIKKIPAEKFDKIALKISLEEEKPDDPLNQLFGKASELHSKARKSIGIEAEGEDTTNQSASHQPKSFADDSMEPKDDDSQEHHENESETAGLVHPVPDDSGSKSD